MPRPQVLLRARLVLSQLHTVNSMAIWQVDLQMIPMSDKSNDDSGNSVEFPLSMAIVHQAQQRLCEYLGSPWYVLPDWLVYGPENGSRIDIVFISPHVASLTVRFDLRNESQQFLILICRLAWHLGCRFYSADLKQIIVPNEQAVNDALIDAHRTIMLLD